MTEPAAIDRMPAGWLTKYVKAWDRYELLCIHRASTDPELIRKALKKAVALEMELSVEACRDKTKAAA